MSFKYSKYAKMQGSSRKNASFIINDRKKLQNLFFAVFDLSPMSQKVLENAL